MMKQKLICAAMAFLLVLTGCADGKAPESSEAVASDSVSAESSSAPETSEAGSEQIIEPVGAPVSITDYSGLSRIDTEFSPDNMSELNGGRVLLTDSESDGKINVGMLSLDSMTLVTNELNLPADEYSFFSTAPFFLEGKPVVAELMSGKVYLLDDTLSVADSLELGGSEYYSIDYLDDSRLYFKRYYDSVLTEVTLSDGKLSAREVELNCGENRYAQGVSFLSENEKIVSVYDDTSYEIKYCLLDESTDVLTLLNVANYEVVQSYGGDILVYDYTDNEVTVWSAETPSMKRVIAFPADSWQLYTRGKAENLYFSSDKGGNSVLYRISPKTGSITATAEIPCNEDIYSYIGTLTEYGDRVLVLGNFDGTSSLFLWTPETLAPERGWTALSAENYRDLSAGIAQEIESAYGIRVLYGNDAVRYFSSYAVVSETDERRIYSSLSTIKMTLAKFPSGFLRELAGYNDIDILLTSSILSNGISRDSITTAAAFTDCDWDSKKETVVIDINGGNLEMNLAHEFCHVIEDTMFSLSYADSETIYELFARWQMMNPEGFQYAYIYTNEDGSTIDWYDSYLGMSYFDGGEMELSDVYFVDGYATTYPKEDRARIFEYMFTMETDLPAYFASPHIQEKAGYMFQCMRECFETLTQCDDIVWERGLTVQHDMQWYRENYSDWESMAMG